jgi:hypothetical protein
VAEADCVAVAVGDADDEVLAEFVPPQAARANAATRTSGSARPAKTARPGLDRLDTTHPGLPAPASERTVA